MHKIHSRVSYLSRIVGETPFRGDLTLEMKDALLLYNLNSLDLAGTIQGVDVKTGDYLISRSSFVPYGEKRSTPLFTIEAIAEALDSDFVTQNGTTVGRSNGLFVLRRSGYLVVGRNIANKLEGVGGTIASPYDQLTPKESLIVKSLGEHVKGGEQYLGDLFGVMRKTKEKKDI